MHRMRILVFLFPVILFLLFLYIKIELPQTYASIIQEDSLVENAQVVFYLISAGLSFFVSMKFLKNKMTLHGILYFVLAVGLLFTALEEISWGQRIFNIETPVYFKRHNFQKELSLHNLYAVQPMLHNLYIIIGAYGAFAWIFTYPFFSGTKTNDQSIVNYVVPDWYISSYFFFTFFIYGIFEYMRPLLSKGFLLWRDQEPVELLLSLGFLSFLINNYVRLQECLKSRSKKRGKRVRR
jgi:hypothetical protein